MKIEKESNLRKVCYIESGTFKVENRRTLQSAVKLDALLSNFEGSLTLNERVF